MPSYTLIYYFIFSIFLFLIGCDSNSNAPTDIFNQKKENAIVSKLANIESNHIYSSEYALKQAKKKISSNNSSINLYRYAKALLRNGDTEASIIELEKLRNLAILNSTQNQLNKYNFQLGLSYLRLGEQNYCIENNNAASCILPITKDAIYPDHFAINNAINYLNECLEAMPKNNSAKWLLNLAYMLKGKYPSEVPKDYLINPSNFKSEESIGIFNNIGNQIGLNEKTISGGAIMDDFNNDGYLDLVMSEMDLDGQLLFYKNNGDGTFENSTTAAGLLGQLGGLNIVQTDYNNDGWLDMYILRGAWFGKSGLHPNSLLKNNGDGTFTDVTIESGLLTEYPTQTAIWADVNSDGWLDLFIGNEGLLLSKKEKTSKENGSPCELYINNNGKFENIAKKANLDKSYYIKGACWIDYNNDLKPDLCLSLRHDYNVFYENISEDKNIKFKEIDVGISKPIKSFAAWSWDYNNDGWEDIYIADYNFNNKSGQPIWDQKSNAGFYMNNGKGQFLNYSEQTNLKNTHLTMGSNFGDFNNDGWLDFYLGTGAPNFDILLPNRMFLNSNGEKFLDITMSANVGHIQKGHGIAIGDIDNDGDQDIFAEMGGAFDGDIYQNILFENPGQGNNWVTFKLIGVNANKLSIGSKLELLLSENSTERKIFRTIGNSSSFGSSSTQEEIGIGKATMIKEMKIIWAGSNIKQVFKNISPNQFYTVIEGQNDLKIDNRERSNNGK